MAPIRPEDFSKKNNFGPPGLIPPMVERNLGAAISPSRLIKYFSQAYKLVDDRSQFKSRFSEQDCAQLVQKLFGKTDSINIQNALQELRTKDATPEIKLLIRTLALHSFDLLSPDQTKRVNPRQLWEDLHLLDRDILPEARTSGAGKFIVYRLALNETGYSRLHIYPPGDGVTVDQDGKIHGHAGDASSIILAGKLVNSHHAVKYSDQPTDLAVYEVTNQTQEGENKKIFTKQVHISPPTLLSTHVYQPGEYYHIPGTLTPEYKATGPLKMTPEMDNTYHTVGTMDLCATLFTKRRMPQNDAELAVISRGESQGAEQFTRIDADYKAGDPKECYDLLMKADKAIREQLKHIDKVDCTYLSQLSNSAIDDSINRSL